MISHQHRLRPAWFAVAALSVITAVVVALTATASPSAEQAAASSVAAEQQAARAEARERAEQARVRAEADRQAALEVQRAAEEAARLAAEAEAQRVAEEAARAQAEAEEAARVEAERQAAAEQAARSAERSAADPKSVARAMLGEYGWGGDQFSCLEKLWQKESNWDHTAKNRSSGAYGIPQSLPGSKMASAGSDWQTNPATQIAWGLGYIAERYGSPCSAWGHSQAKNWY